MEHKLQCADSNLRTIFEKVINELLNIEYVLNYFISISEKNKKKKFSRIESNDSIHIKSQATKKKTFIESSMIDSPDLMSKKTTAKQLAIQKGKLSSSNEVSTKFSDRGHTIYNKNLQPIEESKYEQH